MTAATAGPLPRAFRLVAVDRVASTMDLARGLAEEGAPDGTLVWAQAQTAGRGRRGRAWESPRGNLYCSLLLRPGCRLADASQLSFVAALAIADAVAASLPDGVPVSLKWPNDVLADGAKVSGLLLEAETDGEGGAAWVVLGIGINVAAAPAGTPYPAACLADLGGDAPAGVVLARLADALDRRLARWRAEGFGPVRAEWLERARGVGGPVAVRLPDRTLDGVFRDLDADGALVLSMGDGRTARVGAGDVYFPAAEG